MFGEEEFGESRFLDELRQTRRLPLEQVVTTVFTAVQQFSGGNQSDDLTLVVARVKSELAALPLDGGGQHLKDHAQPD